MWLSLKYLSHKSNTTATITEHISVSVKIPEAMSRVNDTSDEHRNTWSRGRDKMRGVIEEFQIQLMSINHLEPQVHSHII